MIKVGTIFSGIGSIEWALERMSLENKVIFACDNGDVDLPNDLNLDLVLNKVKKIQSADSMWDHEMELYNKVRKENFVRKSYLHNHKINHKRFYQNVKIFDGSKFKGEVDLLVGGSPCQSFSIMGEKRGLDDVRGTLFYDYARIVSEVKPKVFIYENVQGLLKHDDGKTWEVMKQVFDGLGYHFKFKVLNSKEYGIPQNRNRIFVVGFRNKKFFSRFSFPNPIHLESKMQEYLEEYCKPGYFSYEKNVHMPGSVDEKYFPSEKVIAHVMSTGTKNYKTVPKIDLEIARPLLATMHKMHRAAVDNYVTVNGRIRKLTPRECLRLMGYGDEFIQIVSDTQMYKQCGNSIVVDIFIHLIKNIKDTKVF